MDLQPGKESDLQKQNGSEGVYSVFESLNYPVCIIGTDGILAYSNESFKTLFGSDQSETRLSLEHPLFPEYRKRVAQAYLGALNGIEKQCFAVLNTPDGKEITTEMYLFPMYTDQAVSSILVLLKTVNDRILSFDGSTLSLISEDNFQYDNLHFEFSPIPIMRINRDGEIIKCSHSLESLLGYTSSEIVEKQAATCETIFKYDSKKIKKTCDEIINANIPFKRIGEVKIETKAEQDRIVNLTLYPILIQSEIQEVEMVMEDITLMIDLKNRIATNNSIELFMDITKGYLHSLNNYVNIITSKTQMLMQITEKDSVLNGIQTIEESAIEIVKQTRRIQDFISRKDEIDESTTEPLVNIIEDAIEFSKMRFKVEDKEKRRNIFIEKKYFTGVNVKSDTRLLREIIVSIILRVSQFIEKRGSIQINLKENNDITLSVITKKDIQTEPVSIQGDTINVFTGSDVRKVAEKIKVKIIEEESPEYYSIKAIFPHRMIINSQKNEPGEMEYKLRDLDIIIVEDEAALQRILYELFDRMGNRVFICDDGDEALKEFKKKKYDLVITDYGISGITGLELAARIKEYNENAITVLLSGWMLNDIDSYKNVVDLFLPKPFKLDELLKKTAKIMKDHSK